MQTIKNELPETFSLRHGAHSDFEAGACLLEAVSYLAGEHFSDSPACACPVIAALGRRLNDALPDDETRTKLLIGLAPKLVGSRSTKAVEQRRSYLMLDVTVREIAPLWLECHPDLAAFASQLRALPEIVDSATLEQGFAVRDAARSAAWDVRRKEREALEAKIKDALLQAKPEGLRDRILAEAAAAAVAVAEAVAAAAAAVAAAAAAVAEAAAAAAAVAAAAEAAAAEAAVAEAAAAAVAAAADCPRRPGESDDDYYWRLRDYFWGAGYSKIRAATRQAVRTAIREKHGDLLEKTWALQVSCIERCLTITEIS
jgi:hypothetical protein